MSVIETENSASTIRYQYREQSWKSGIAASPLNEFRRYEIPPPSAEDRAAVRPELLAALQAIDPTFEIIFDRFTQQNKGGPAFHLCRRISNGTSPADDRLVLEVSIQQKLQLRWKGNPINLIWPKGGPCAPGSWLIPIVRERYVGPMDGEKNVNRNRLVRGERARHRDHAAERIRDTINIERDATAEIIPYLPTELGGRARTIRRTGRALVTGRKGNPRYFDFGRKNK